MSKTKKKQNKKLRKHSANPVEIVEWEDHWAVGSSWHEGGIDRNPLIVKSAGIRVYEDKKVLQITPMMNSESLNPGSIVTILKKCITKRKTL